MHTRFGVDEVAERQAQGLIGSGEGGGEASRTVHQLNPLAAPLGRFFLSGMVGSAGRMVR